MTKDDWLCWVTHTHHESTHKPPAASRTVLILTAADRLIKSCIISAWKQHCTGHSQYLHRLKRELFLPGYQDMGRTTNVLVNSLFVPAFFLAAISYFASHAVGKFSPAGKSQWKHLSALFIGIMHGLLFFLLCGKEQQWSVNS